MLPPDWEPCFVSVITRSYQLRQLCDHGWDTSQEPKRRAIRKIYSSTTQLHWLVTPGTPSICVYSQDTITAVDAISFANLLGKGKETWTLVHCSLFRKYLYWCFSFWCTILWQLDHDLPEAIVHNLFNRWYTVPTKREPLPLTCICYYLYRLKNIRVYMYMINVCVHVCVCVCGSACTCHRCAHRIILRYYWIT